MSDRLLGLVLARAGSKRLPGKNARPLAGLSLIERSLMGALSAKSLDAVGFSTDSDKFIQLAQRAGLEETYRRPPFLGSDAATSADTVIDYVTWREAHGDNFSHVVLMQPTSPFRTAAHIDGAIAEWRASGRHSLVSAARLAPNGGYALTRDGQGVLTQLDVGLDALILDGAIYITPVAMIRDEGRFWTSESAVYVTDYPRWFDIDTEADFLAAEALMSAGGQSINSSVS